MDVACSQCGARVPLRERDDLVVCRYCNATLYFDLSRTVLHFFLEPTFPSKSAVGILDRFLAEHDIAGRGRTKRLELFYSPIWSVVRGKDTVLEPAAPNLGLDDAVLAFPSGSLKPMDLDALSRTRFEMPSVSLESVLGRIPENGKDAAATLVHLPIIELDYEVGGADYRVFINAVTGTASAAELPPPRSLRFDVKFMAVAACVIGLFALESALVPGFWHPLLVVGITAVALFFLLGWRLLHWMSPP